jgi:hypothetical protein
MTKKKSTTLLPSPSPLELQSLFSTLQYKAVHDLAPRCPLLKGDAHYSQDVVCWQILCRGGLGTG